MSKGFKFSLLAIVGFILFFIGIGSLYKPKLKQDNPSHIESNHDEKLEQATIALHDAEIDVKQTKEPMSLEQTKEFIERIDQLRANDSKVNLDYLPDVAGQSRKYNDLVDEAVTIYGDNDSANPLRFCTNIAWMARELWTLRHSQTSASKEYHDHSRKMFLASYDEAKKVCMEDIQVARK